MEADYQSALVFGLDDNEKEPNSNGLRILDTDNHCPTITKRPMLVPSEDPIGPYNPTEILSYRSNRFMQPNIAHK